MLHFVDVATGDTRQVPDAWTEEQIADYLAKNPEMTTKKLIQRIRWTVIAGSVVLHDDWSPYKALHSGAVLPHFVRGRTSGLLVENLIDSRSC